MRRWLKRILAVIAVVLFAIIVICVGGIILYKGTPDWYGSSSTAQQRQAAARVAEAKLTETQNWAELTAGDSIRLARAREQGTPPPATRVAATREILFSQDELNGLFEKWSEVYGWSNKYGEWIEEPRIVLHDDSLILAAKIKELGAVTSFHFALRLDEAGKLHLDVVKVMGGRLPLPDPVWEGQKQKVTENLRRMIATWQRSARIDADGVANGPAMYVTLSRLVLHAAAHEPAEPVLFLPLVENSRSVPVRVTNLAVGDDGMALEVRKLSADERQQLVDQIHGPE